MKYRNENDDFGQRTEHSLFRNTVQLRRLPEPLQLGVSSKAYSVLYPDWYTILDEVSKKLLLVWTKYRKLYID
jgi:hypothetical protein